MRHSWSAMAVLLGLVDWRSARPSRRRAGRALGGRLRTLRRDGSCYFHRFSTPDVLVDGLAVRSRGQQIRVVCRGGVGVVVNRSVAEFHAQCLGRLVVPDCLDVRAFHRLHFHPYATFFAATASTRGTTLTERGPICSFGTLVSTNSGPR